MPKFRITAPDGTVYNVDGPDGATEEQALAQVQAQHQPPKEATTENGGVLGSVKNLVGGAVRGAGSIGATLLWPYDKASDLIAGDGQSRNDQRRTAMDEGLRSLGADPDSSMFKVGKLGGEIAGTAGVGGVLANGARAVGAAPELVSSIATGGFRTGASTNLIGQNVATRLAGGAVTGGASAGLVKPDDAVTGAAVGGLLPPLVRGAGALGQKVGRAVIGDVAPEVAQLADRAKQLGIDIPADRITNSRPLNAVAAGLNYVPFSGRQATEQKMQDQLNTALSKTFGQDSPNVTKALRDGQKQLGAEFDRVLKGNDVTFDKQLLSDIGDVQEKAARELGKDGLSAIDKQIDELISKGGNGTLDGQAAYNIKRDLDRIGQRNTPEAYHARELKKALMGALDRSLGPEEAAKFATTRKQYGNMLDLEPLAQNGAEGDISIARLANMKHINNSDLQELADISAQFLKPREGMHGAAQRAAAGLGISFLGGPAGLAATAASGRGANLILNSQTAKNAVLGRGSTNLIGRLPLQTVPVLTADESR